MMTQAVVLLDGEPVTDFAFANGILKTTAPLAWTAPSGEPASVHLHLQFSAFAGYGEGHSLSSYLGVQVGLLRPPPCYASPWHRAAKSWHFLVRQTGICVRMAT